MRLVKVILFFFSALTVTAQSAFIKTSHAPDFGSQIKVVATSDEGWAVFSLDSMRLSKYNKCGHLVWTKKIVMDNVSWVADIIALQPSGFAILTRCEHNTIYSSHLVKLDASGNVLWSKFFEDPSYNQVPYTVLQTSAQDIIIYASSENILLNPIYNLLVKVDTNGNILWAKYYNHGGIWGGAILTSDGGILARTNSIFIKTDGNGMVQWTSVFGSNAYFYFPPVEVNDGYIFNGRINGTNLISFGKMDKSGNKLWTGRKSMDFSGSPSLLHALPSGNFVTVANKFLGTKNYPTVVEFDKELNVIRNSSIAINQAGIDLTARDVCPLKNNSWVTAGKAAILNPGTSSVNFIAATDSLFLTGCDSLISFNMVTDTIPQNFGSTAVLNTSFSSYTLPVNTVNVIDSVTLICGGNQQLQLSIAGDSLICPGAAITLSAASTYPFDEYRWSTGETTSTVIVTAAGTYELRAVANCGADTVVEAITILNSPLSLTPDLKDVFICSDTLVIFDVSTPGAEYVWQDGSTQSTYSASIPGTYVVDISLGNCHKLDSAKLESCEVLIMPNVFTPNGDNFNNEFIPIQMRGIAEATLYVYNRWGQKLYTSHDILHQGWTAKQPPHHSSDGVYYWIVEYSNYRNEHKTQHGTVTVVSSP